MQTFFCCSQRQAFFKLSSLGFQLQLQSVFCAIRLQLQLQLTCCYLSVNSKFQLELKLTVITLANYKVATHLYEYPVQPAAHLVGVPPVAPQREKTQRSAQRITSIRTKKFAYVV